MVSMCTSCLILLEELLVCVYIPVKIAIDLEIGMGWNHIANTYQGSDVMLSSQKASLSGQSAALPSRMDPPRGRLVCQQARVTSISLIHSSVHASAHLVYALPQIHTDRSQAEMEAFDGV